jgi:aspartate carbamoyltransferase catalytic subunit
LLKGSNLLGLETLEARNIESILDTAESFREILDRPIKKVPTLRGQTVVNLFFEPSTRTRVSFELAEKRLSADSVNFSSSGSSVSKGETLKDTARNIEAMSVDMLVIRHPAAGAPHYLASCVDARVINAGDGAHEHPTQALLDMFTVRRKLGRLKDLRVAIIGDIAHSRVARSNIWGFRKLGATVAVCGPSTLMPAEVEKTGVDVHHRVEEAIEGADVVMVLRIQLERQKEALFSSLREYAKVFGVSSSKLRHAKDGVVVMHPGPMNRGIEIAQDVADGPFSVILQQVTNGVAVRMAVLYLLSGVEETKESLVG